MKLLLSAFVVTGHLLLLSWLNSTLLAQENKSESTDTFEKLVLPASSSWKTLKSNAERTVWLGASGDYYMVSIHKGESGVPLISNEKLREYVRNIAAKEKGGLIEARIVRKEDQPVAYFITKDTYKNLMGYRYVGRCVIPFEGGWHEVRMDTLPVGTTGQRESVLAMKLNLYANREMEPVPPDALPTPGNRPVKEDAKRIKGWFKDPYNEKFNGTANYTETDHAKYDSKFPKHQLSRLRTQFPKILGLELDPAKANGKVESKILRQEMIDLTTAVMKERLPNVDRIKVRQSVERGIAAFRKVDPNFLMVSTEDEQNLKSGKGLDSSSKRIEIAQQFYREFELKQAGPIVALNQKFEAGTLTLAQTELLAQLLTVEMKKASEALSN